MNFREKRKKKVRRTFKIEPNNILYIAGGTINIYSTKIQKEII